MKFLVSTLVVAIASLASASAVPRGSVVGRQNGPNEDRPVPEAACCVAGVSLKQDVCNVNGESGRCVPDDINNCGEQLTCIEDSRLTCDPNQEERGRPFCRRTGA